MMKKFIKKNESLGAFSKIHGSRVQDVVDTLQEILKKDPNALFRVGPGPGSYAQLSVNYKETPKTRNIEDADRIRKDNRKDIKGETICGCVGCLSIFKGNEITEWVGDEFTQAVCPFCESTWVIPEIEDAQYLVDANATFCITRDTNEYSTYDQADDALFLGRNAIK